MKARVLPRRGRPPIAGMQSWISFVRQTSLSRNHSASSFRADRAPKRRRVCGHTSGDRSLQRSRMSRSRRRRSGAAEYDRIGQRTTEYGGIGQRPVGVDPAGLLNSARMRSHCRLLSHSVALCRTLSHSVALCRTLSFSAPPQTHRGAGRCQLPCVLRRAEELLLLRGLLGGLLSNLLLRSLFLGSHCTTPFKEGLSLAIPR